MRALQLAILLGFGIGVASLTAWRPTTTSTVAAAPARSHEIRMVADARGYRFEPASVHIAAGDTVVFRVVSGQPHSIAFDTTAIAPTIAHTLSMRMRDQIGTLAGPLLLMPGDHYAVSFAGLPAGRYPFFCLPHAALKMNGEIVVQ